MLKTACHRYFVNQQVSKSDFSVQFRSFRGITVKSSPSLRVNEDKHLVTAALTSTLTLRGKRSEQAVIHSNNAS